MKKLLCKVVLIGAALAALASSAFAQSYSGVTLNSPVTNRTYSASITALAPAASATDFLTVTGVAGHIVRVTRAECSGTATAAGAAAVVALVRSTANTAGTSTTPVAVALDGVDGAAGAVVKSYTANPTIGTLVGPVRTGFIGLAANASAVAAAPLAWDFGNRPASRIGVVLRGATQVFALNGNGASFPAGTSLNCSVEWEEQ
jgi:hypothetical protein